jgi:hypothetical protein
VAALAAAIRLAAAVRLAAAASAAAVVLIAAGHADEALAKKTVPCRILTPVTW